MMLRREYNPLEATSKVINLQEGCLRYLHYLRTGKLEEKLEEVRKYFTGSVDVIDLLIASEKYRTYRYYIWMDRTGNDRRVDEMIKELKAVRKTIDEIQKGTASEKDAKEVERVLDKIASYLLTKGYHELLKEARKYVIGGYTQ
jgi:hypothetical protein